MTDSRFRDALAVLLYEEAENAAACSHRPEVVRYVFLDANSRHYMADAVLASRELQAIRAAIRSWAESERYAFGGITPPGEAMADRGLPESVVAWLFEDDST